MRCRAPRPRPSGSRRDGFRVGGIGRAVKGQLDGSPCARALRTASTATSIPFDQSMRATMATLSGGCGGQGSGPEGFGIDPGSAQDDDVLARGIEAEQLRIVGVLEDVAGLAGLQAAHEEAHGPLGETGDPVCAGAENRGRSRHRPACEPRPCLPRSRRRGCCAARCNGPDRPSPVGESRRDLRASGRS